MHDHTLDNGLRALIQPRFAAPLVAIYVWIDAGTVDEDEGEHGAAHLLEHMLFKGTPTRGIGMSAGEIEGLGGDLNAYTTYDQTVLHATVEASGFERTVNVLADMLRNASIDPDEFVREKQVVLEEIRAYDDEPETVVEDLSALISFPEHPYGRPILGTLDTVNGISHATLVAFWKRHYGPNRCVVAISGAVDAEQAEQAVKAAFGTWPAAQERRPVPIARQLAGPNGARVEREFDSRAVEVCWRMPPQGHPDVPALDVLATVLGVGSASLLQVRLQLDEGLATDAWAGLSMRRGGGVLSASALPRAGSTELTVEGILDVAAGVRARGASRTEVARARDSILADYLFAAETVDGAAHDLAWYTARTGDPYGGEAHRRAVSNVTASDVARVARTWLVPENRTTVVLDRDVSAELVQEKATRPAPRPRPSRPPGPVRFVADNGATLLILPDDSPVAAIRVVSSGGRTREESRTAGITEAWSRMSMAGAGDLDATAFGEAVDDLAGTFDGSAGRNGIGLRATFPADAIEGGIELTADVLLDPHFDTEEWERVRGELIEEVDTIDDRPAQVASEVLWKALFPRHPWRFPRYGTHASLNNIGPGTLKTWHKAHFRADNLVIAVAGGVDPDDVILQCKEWIGELPAGPTRPPSLTPGAPQVGDRRRKAGREQAHIVAGWRGLATSDPDRVALSVLTSWLNGQAGRLFLELRERRGLAYSVWAQSLEGLDHGAFLVGMATDPERVVEARSSLQDVLQSVIDAPPSEADIASAVRMCVGHSAMGLQRALDRASDAALGERFGVVWGFDAQRAQLQSITTSDVQRVAQRILRDRPVRVTVEPRG